MNGHLRIFHGLPLLVGLLAASAAASAAESPNILFILADDLGWRDLGCYGGELADTPHLDRLASQGMRFTDAYAPAPICSASRAAFLTGRSPARLHFEFVTKPAGTEPPRRTLVPPPYTQDLPLEEVTIAEVLKTAGYATGFFGKWHLNEHYGRYLGWSPTHGPPTQGFDTAEEDFGSHPYAGEEGNPPPEQYAAGQFPPDTMIERSIRFLEHNTEGPFFLMVSQFHVHTPVKAPAPWLYGKYAARAARGPGDAEKRAHYGAFLETLDHHVGQLLGALDRLGLDEKTLVVFTSDNGGHPEYAANGPLRGSKWNLYEGGIRVPLIARWPGRIRPGSTCEQPASGTDLLPTFCAAAGAERPPGELDGHSLLPLLTGRGQSWPERPLVWHFPYYHPEKGYEKALPAIGVDDFAVSQTRPQSALRLGSRKLLYFHEDHRLELYDLAKDLGEQHDLAAEDPEQARMLRDLLLAELSSVDARLPLRGEEAAGGSEP